MEAAATQTVFPWITNVIIAIMILLIGFMAGKLIGSLMKSLFREVQLNKAINTFTEQRINFAEFLSSIITTIIYIITFFLALDKLGIAFTAIIIILGIFIIILIGALLLGIRDFIPNIYAGILIKSRKKLKLNQTISVKTAKGKIVKIGLLRTKLISGSNEVIMIPNHTIKKELTNSF